MRHFYVPVYSRLFFPFRPLSLCLDAGCVLCSPWTHAPRLPYYFYHVSRPSPPRRPDHTGKLNEEPSSAIALHRPPCLSSRTLILLRLNSRLVISAFPPSLFRLGIENLSEQVYVFLGPELIRGNSCRIPTNFRFVTCFCKVANSDSQPPVPW